MAKLWAESNAISSDQIGVLFEINNDLSVPLVPFVLLNEGTHHKDEKEVLFSMHTIFPVGSIQLLDGKNPFLYHTQLTLTSDDDPHLRELTKVMLNETSTENGWKRLGELLLKLGHDDATEKLYVTLLETALSDFDRAIYLNQLGLVYFQMRECSKALQFYKKALEICQRILLANDTSIGISYCNIGRAYSDIGKYFNALWHLKKSVEILLENPSQNQQKLCGCYANIGGLYSKMNAYGEALSFHERALAISRNNLPSNHPYLPTHYSNISGVYCSLGQYNQALNFSKKNLQFYKNHFLVIIL